jgi:hypothetical protein
LGAFALASGQIAAPQIDVQIGPYHLVSRTTSAPNCHPLSAGCAANGLASRRSAVYYSIWAVSVTEVPVAGGVIEQLNTVRLLVVPVAR